MQWTVEQITAVAAAVSLIIAAIFAKPVVEAVLRIMEWWRIGREKRLAQKAIDDELNDKGHRFIIRRLDRRISELEKTLQNYSLERRAIQEEHAKCREDFAGLHAKFESLREECECLRTECEVLRERIAELENE